MLLGSSALGLEPGESAGGGEAGRGDTRGSRTGGPFSELGLGS